MKTYIIYRHTINNKHYIGYSAQTLEERLEEHIQSSLVDNSERHFHRAIRKYGSENIISEIIDTADTRSEAIEKERRYITIHDTFRNGYNMTLGGDGGNTKEGYTEEEMREWKDKASKRQSGMSNNNARPDISVERIITNSVEYIVNNDLTEKHVTKKELLMYLKEKINISEETLRRRGIKNITSLFKLINEELESKNLKSVIYNPYYRSEDEKKHLAKMASGYSWATDGITSKQIKRDEIDKYLTENTNYKKGRTI